jgi:putative tricarboxylic transport membrane protein
VNKPDEASSPAVDRPWWLGAVIIAIGLFWIYGATLLPQTAAYAKVGPGMFVTLAGLGLVFFGAILLVQIARGERFEAQEGEDVAADKPTSWPALMTALAAGLVPIYTMQRFGFVPTAMLVFALTARAFGSVRLLFDLVVGLLIAALSWYGFTLLGVGLGPAAKLPGLLDLLPSLKPF